MLFESGSDVSGTAICHVAGLLRSYPGACRRRRTGGGSRLVRRAGAELVDALAGAAVVVVVDGLDVLVVDAALHLVAPRKCVTSALRTSRVNF